MTSKFIFLVCTVATFLVVQSCQNKTSGDKPEYFETSELAELMRQMAEQKEEIKASIKDGSFDPHAVKRLFEKLDSAEATKSNTKDAVFYSFSKAYAQSMEQFLSAPDSSRTKAYNATVQACIQCHQQFCQLPIERIEKLYIK